MSEMQECLHEEECRRREVRLCQLQGVSKRWAAILYSARWLCTSDERRAVPVTGVQVLAARLALSRSASSQVALHLGRRVGA